MNRKVLWYIFLILLPVVAVGLATTHNSVMVYNTQTQQTLYCSYFTLLPEGTLRVTTPLAAVCCIVAGGLAIAYVAGRQKSLLMGIQVVSFAAALLATLPILIGGTIRVVPNVALPILMVCQWLLSAIMYRKGTAGGKEKREPRRLSQL